MSIAPLATNFGNSVDGKINKSAAVESRSVALRSKRRHLFGHLVGLVG